MSLGFDERDRESVLRDLRSEDAEVRRLAVERIDALPSAESIPCLVDRLGDASWRVRKAAVDRLVASPHAERVGDELIAALADGENSGRRNAAVEALIEAGERMVPHLIEATRDGDADVRKLAVDSLAGIGDPRAIDALIALLEDGDPNVRAAAADGLGAIGGDAIQAPLLRAATDEREDPIVRFSALHALAALDAPVPAGELASVLDDPVLRSAALTLLGRRDDPEALAVLLKGLTCDSRSSREAAMRSLLQLLSQVDGARADRIASDIRDAVRAADGVVAGSIARLDHADLSTRLILIQFLGLLGREEAVVPILVQARDEALAQVAIAALESLGELSEEALDAAWSQLDGQARHAAYQLFGRTGGPRGAARLLSALDDPDPMHRIAAAHAIGRRGMPEALTPLVLRLEAAAADDDVENEDEIAVLTDALIALTRPEASGDDGEGAIELLASRLDGAPESVRLAIARVLGRIGRPQDTGLVAFLLKDPGARVRRAAVDALARLEPGTAAEPLRLALADESAAVRIAAARALGASESEQVIDDLRRLTVDEDARVRAAAVYAAATRFLDGPPACREAGLEVIEAAFGDEAPVALAAVEALRDVGGPEASRAAELLSRPEPEVLIEAIRCLGVDGDPAPLIPLVSHPDWSVRAEAIGVLAERAVARAVPSILRRLETEQDEFVRGAILRALKRLEG